MVVMEIGRLHSHLDRLEKSNTDLLVDQGKLRLIAAMCGAMAGIAATLIAHAMV